ncbi:hypothetical protein CWN88_15145 [Vibrio splendidus]|nr:hypothetical protein CWN82_09315 [Vibrio splendidus]PTP00270.1 hypothetical protein CWN88_15145 [Vibrio splendidus]
MDSFSKEAELNEFGFFLLDMTKKENCIIKYNQTKCVLYEGVLTGNICLIKVIHELLIFDFPKLMPVQK